MTSRAPFLHRTPGAKEIVEYLRAHGPATTSTMKADGLEFHRGLTKRMHELGIIRPAGHENNARIWEVVE